MMIKVVLLSLIAVASAVPYVGVRDDGSYQFFYETGEDSGNQMRSEVRGSDGVVIGKYGYMDPTGEHRVVNYRADDFGYVAKGDVSVPGAGEGQFPAEPADIQNETGYPEENKDDSDENENKENSNEKKDEPNPEESKANEENEQDEDDVKPIKLQEASEDAPPEGFPVGFFTHQFHNIRRLPEPKNEDEVAEKEKKPETNEKNGEAKEDSKANEAKVGPEAHHDPHFSSFAHPNWAGPISYVPGVHQPVYVYSYNHPQAHGYYYFY